jgi:Arc/MetJ-type ribon-helix-helix transcriptional regulator
MDSPVTLRLDKHTRERVAQIARRKRVSTSEVIRQAIESWIKIHEDAAAATPYRDAADLIGVVHGGNPKRSTRTGAQFKQLLKKTRNRA